jgi:hypothetical protein
MTIRLRVATALAGTLIAACFVSWSAQATSMPVLKSNAPSDIVTLVKHGGGHHGGGHHAHHGGGGKHHYGGGGRHYAHKGDGHGHYDRHRHHGHYRSYGYYGWYGWPGYYGGGCGWLYRRAIATGSPYWWDRYYDCIGYY